MPANVRFVSRLIANAGLTGPTPPPRLPATRPAPPAGNPDTTDEEVAAEHAGRQPIETAFCNAVTEALSKYGVAVF
jgi:hypothetical protein